MEPEKRPNVHGSVRGPKGDVKYTLYNNRVVKYHTEIAHKSGKQPSFKLLTAENGPELREQAAARRVLAKVLEECDKEEVKRRAAQATQSMERC